jgi:undecaprenyl-phosphate 4-deoxy-4-formamido-L-arabinose transferase
MKISVCIPVYNGSETIKNLVDEVEIRLNSYDLEVILVNDGSLDNSEAVCEQISREKTFVKFISLRKNFGENNAVMCALNFATGDYAVVIDDDFQNPPSEIIKLIRQAVEGGYDVVYSRYREKKHSWFRNLGSRFHNNIADLLLDKPRGLYLSTFRLIKKEIVDEIIQYKGPSPYIDGLILRVTGNIGSVEVQHSSRRNGTSNYTLKKLVEIWLDMFINFSIKPLRMMMFLGFILSLLGFVSAVYFIIEKLFLNPDMPVGFATLIVTILVLSGIQLVFAGLLGEYVGKHYMQANGTPQWVIKKKSF